MTDSNPLVGNIISMYNNHGKGICKFIKNLRQIPTLNMFILTLLRMNFNMIGNIIFEGEKEIPKGHFLFGKRVWKCGSYIRKLTLYCGRIIQIRIYRFYSLDTRETYSLIPFFIQPYERHINTVIESVLEVFFEYGVDESYCKRETPSEWTERRWIKKYVPKIEDLNQRLAEYMVQNYPNYLPADKPLDSKGGILESISESVAFIFSHSKNWIYLYGYLSLCFWCIFLEPIETK